VGDLRPVLAAELGYSLLVGFEVVGFVLVAFFEDFVRGVPEFRNADEMVDVEVDGWNVLPVD
jgi:hypothetical protein